jgi:2-polyprenyl-3-methyl-5-hydroxy-6-metoxy-1,4-benzoquinol methylase
VNHSTCPICYKLSNKIKSFWLSFEPIYNCPSCKFFFRDRQKAEIFRFKEFQKIYLDETHGDPKKNGLNYFASDLISEIQGFHDQDKNIIIDYGSGDGGLKKILSSKLINQPANIINVDLQNQLKLKIETNEEEFVIPIQNNFIDFISNNMNLDNSNCTISVCMHHVLEHMEDPRNFLSQLSNNNKVNYLVIEVPAERYFKIRTFVYFLIRKKYYFEGHINFFSSNSLKQLLELSNWRIVSIKTRNTQSNQDLIDDLFYSKFMQRKFLRFIVFKILKILHIRFPLTYYVFAVNQS